MAHPFKSEIVNKCNPQINKYEKIILSIIGWDDSLFMDGDLELFPLNGLFPCNSRDGAC